MKNIRTELYPAGRLEAGAAVLAAAETADVTLVQRRLDAFARAHRAYQQAYGVVETAEAQLQARLVAVTERNANQDAAIEDLAAALVGDRQRRANPFAAFASGAPSAVKELKYGEKAKTIRRLATAVRTHPGLKTATRGVAQAAEEAARLLEKDLLAMEKVQAALHTARQTREAVGKTWDTALAALKLDARAAAADGSPVLYRALFGRSRPKNKTAAKPEPEQPAVTPEPEQPATTPAPRPAPAQAA